MKILPNSIAEEVWKEHLRFYSHTIVDYLDEVKEVIPQDLHTLLPYCLYLCPLCLKNYFIETPTKVVGNAEFSLDHLPPYSVGGRLKIITCRKCNNDSGTFESELEKLMNFGDDKTDSENGTKLNVRVVDPQSGIYIKGVARKINNEMDITFDSRLKNNRKDYINFLSKLHSNDLTTLNIQFRVPDMYDVQRALMKSAYLFCFVWWGYEFAFSKSGILMREVIVGKGKYLCKIPTKWTKAINAPLGISIITDGDKRLCFLVNLRLNGIRDSTTASILIPGPTEDSWSNVAKLSSLSEQKESMEFNCISIPQTLHRFGYTLGWNLPLPS